MARKKAEDGSTEAITTSNFVRCRFCGQKNAVKTDYEKDKAVCGKCRLPLSNSPHKKFADLSKHDYVHPADSKALAALKAIPGVDSGLKKLLEITGESASRVVFMASAVKVTPKQCPDLYAKLQVVCTTLGVDMPDLFVQQNPVVNAFTTGVEKPLIVLWSGLLERLTDEEVLAVLAHEVGHIQAEHVLYLTAARLFEALTNASLGKLVPGSEIIKALIAIGINSSLMAWARRAELSCDRAAMLVVQDPHIVGRTMMKLCGGTSATKLDYNEFLEQAREFEKTCDDNSLDKFWAGVISSGMTHPFPVWRVSEILKWVDSGDYDKLLKNK
jgi:Zn-dependent protease with chaperone function